MNTIFLALNDQQVEVLYSFLVQMIDNEGFEMEKKEDQEALEAIVVSLEKYLNYMDSQVSEEEQQILEEKFGGEK